MNILFEQTLFKGNGHWRIQAVEGFTGQGEPQSGMLIAHATVVDGAEVIKFSPTKGKNIGKANETTAEQQAVSEAQSRVAKQRDKGYVDTREEAQAGPATNTLGKKKPMLATDFDKVKPEAIDWANAFIQPKLDGHRSLFDEIQYSRQGKEQGVAHIADDLKGGDWFEGMHLDGELYVHGMTLQAIGSLIKKYREESLKLEYHVYDLVADIPFEQRYAALANSFKQSEGLRDERIVLVPTHKVDSLDAAQAFHKQFVAAGYEGSILRHGTQGYEDDKRSKGLLKLKDFSDLEVEVFDFEWGTPNTCPAGGEYLNPVLVYRIPGTEITGKVTAPGSHAEKHAQGQNIESYLGNKLLTIEHMGFTPDGVPNIATAKCWREEL